MPRGSISTIEWLTLVGAILISGVGVTAFAMTTFESASTAEKRESRMEKRIDRLEDLQIKAMQYQGIPIPPIPPAKKPDEVH